jgi:hypothetical protein
MISFFDVDLRFVWFARGEWRNDLFDGAPEFFPFLGHAAFLCKVSTSRLFINSAILFRRTLELFFLVISHPAEGGRAQGFGLSVAQSDNLEGEVLDEI